MKSSPPGILHSEQRQIRFTVEPFDHTLAVDADPGLLKSAVMNLLHNAFKNTSAGGTVILRAVARGPRWLVEIEDECGGLPESTGNLFQSFGDRRGTDRSGLGLGLSIARKAVRAHKGDIVARNMPGKGCVLAINVPLAAEAAVRYSSSDRLRSMSSAGTVVARVEPSTAGRLMPKPSVLPKGAVTDPEPGEVDQVRSCSLPYTATWAACRLCGPGPPVSASTVGR
jgi:Histidine kinase-, DNA gyrase B-, and HSP90-like ATPase